MSNRPAVHTWEQAVGDSRLSATTKLVLLTLSRWMDKEGGSCFPSQAVIAEKASLTERAVIKHVNIAVEHGFLIKKKRFADEKSKKAAGRKWDANEYQASFPQALRDEQGSGHSEDGVNEVHAWGEQDSSHGVNDVHTNYPRLNILNNNPPYNPPQESGEEKKTDPPDRKKSENQKILEMFSEKFPGWPAEEWEAFVEMRRKLKCPLTLRAAQLSCEKLQTFMDAGDDPIKVLQQSIENSYRGVFALKKQGGNYHGNAGRNRGQNGYNTPQRESSGDAYARKIREGAVAAALELDNKRPSGCDGQW